MHGLGNLSLNSKGFGVSLTAAAVSATGAGAFPRTVTSATVTAGGFGGTAGYTYAWAQVSGDSGISILTAAAAGTAFRATFLAAGLTVSGQFQVTVTDATGATELGALVTVTLKAS